MFKPRRLASKKKRSTVAKRVPRKRNLNKAVKAVIERSAEHKHKSWVIETMAPKDAPIQNTDILPLVGPITSGSAGNQRNGNKVKPMGCWLKGHLCFNPDTGGQETILPKVFVLNSRKYKTNASVLANNTDISTQLLDNWDNGNTSFDGLIEDRFQPVNLDDLTVIKVLNASITKDNTTSSDGKSYYDFVVKIPCPAVLHFDEGSNYITNWAPFVAVGWCSADGGVPVAPYPQTLYSTMEVFMSYIDL